MEYVQGKKPAFVQAGVTESKIFAALGQYVRQHWNQLAEGNAASEQALHRKIRPTLSTIHDQLTDDLFSTPEPLYWPYSCLRLFQEQVMTIDILKLPPNGRIPAHDHPDSIVLNHVFSGTLWMLQDNRSPSESWNRELLNAGETRFTFPDRHNIHGFYTDACKATLISINIHPKGDRLGFKHWHLSTNLISDVNDGLRRPVSYAVMLLALSAFPPPTSASECIMNQAQHELSKRNFQKAAALLEDCAERGHEKAQRKLGHLYLTGLGVEKDAYTAAQWYQKAAIQGDIEAQYNYGIMLLDGVGITEDNLEGFDWIFEAARSGHAEAQKIYQYLLANPAPLEC